MAWAQACLRNTRRLVRKPPPRSTPLSNGYQHPERKELGTRRVAEARVVCAVLVVPWACPPCPPDTTCLNPLNLVPNDEVLGLRQQYLGPEIRGMKEGHNVPLA